MSVALRMATRAWLAWCVVVLALLGCDAPEPATPTPVAMQVAAPAPTSTALPGQRCEHGLPAALCTTCKPELAAVFQSKGDWCDEHGFPESLCPICKPGAGAELAAIDHEAAALEARTIRFDSPAIEARAGIVTQPAAAATPGQRSGASTIACTAKLDFHADRVAEIHAIVPGLVRRVHVELGDEVAAGDALFELQSTRVGDLQAALHGASERERTARANLERKRELLAEQVSSKRQVELAEQELAAAKAEAEAASTVLRMVGAPKSGGSGRFTLTSPIAGTVIRRPALLGLLAQEDVSLATIVDTSLMWVLCEVPEVDASALALGQSLSLAIEGSAQAQLGTVSWIAAEVDPRTRTVTVTAELPNPDGTLRANQFGVATITTAPPSDAPWVPRAAVQRVGTRELVFVREAEGVYRPRVVTRHGEGERVQVEGRVKAGDAIVTTGAPLLRTEILPGSIGAGCCEAEPAGGE